MTDALRAMTVGELLDRTFFFYRKHFLLFVGLAGLPHLVLLAVQLLAVVFRSGEQVAARILAAAVTTLLTALVYLAVVAVSQGTTVIAVSRMHLGREPSIAEAYGAIKGRFFTLVLIMLVAGLATGVGLVLLIIPGILIALMLSLAIPVAVLERTGVWAALTRSAELTKGNRGRIFVIYFLFAVLTYIFYSLWEIPIIVAAGVLARQSARGLPVWTQVAFPVGQFLTQCLVSPLLTIALSLVYYDQRVRKEAFDLEHMMSQLDGRAPA